MRNLLWVLPVAFFFLNPNVACGTDDPQFQYGAAEMQAAIAGTWSFTITPTGGTATEVTVQIDEADTAPGATAKASRRHLIRAAHACGSRTLVKSASACIDISSMPLAITFISGDPSLMSAQLTGVFTVAGTIFQSGMVDLTLGPYQIAAQVDSDGTVVNPYLTALGTTGTLTVTRL
jgi:hypothetical protein